MKKSTKVWGLLTAAAILTPVASFAPAHADGGAKYGNREASSSSYKAKVKKLKETRRMGNSRDTLARLLSWHEVMLDSNARDHTPEIIEDGDQLGPVRNSRAFAIIQLSVYDAVNAFDRKFESYSSNAPVAPRGASRDAAIAYAAFTALNAIYPKQANFFAIELASDLRGIRGSASSIAAGRAVGIAAANAILADRADDRAGAPGTAEAVTFGTGGGVLAGGATKNIFNEDVNGPNTAAPRWRPDPFPAQDTAGLPANERIGLRNVALGANWGNVKPFILNRGDQFRIPAYPAPGSARFRAAFEDVLFVGSDPISFPGSTNDAAKQFIGNYWGYDGTPQLGTPPRLYAQIAVEVANSQKLRDVNEYSRLLAMVHATMGDSGIAAWDSKYFHNYWRPATGIPDANSDLDSTTAGVPNWRPFGASVINLDLPERFTPPFPAYPSGHATFGAATMQTLTSLFGNDTRFTFLSDEYNGLGEDPRGDFGFTEDGVRPKIPVRYRTLLAAQQENGRSRVFNGVHWEPDDTEGQNIGTSIVRFTLANEFRRLKSRDDDHRERDDD